MRDIALTVTGKLGHRGTHPQDLLESLGLLKRFWPSLRIVLGCPEEDNLKHGRAFAQFVDSFVSVPNPALENLPALVASISRQSLQVSSALSTLGNEDIFVARMRTDWLVRDVRKFQEAMEKYAELDVTGTVSYSSARLPLLPIPFFLNDNFTFASREELSRLWKPLAEASQGPTKGNRFFSKSFFMFEGALSVMPEQVIWKRFLTDSETDLFKLDTSLSAIRCALQSTKLVEQPSLSELGLEAPAHVLESTRSPGRFFFGPERGFSRALPAASKLGIAWVYANFLFFVHPAWVAGRLNYLLGKT